MIQLRQRAGVDEVPRHLAFVPFSCEVGVQRSGNFRQGNPNRFPANAVVRERFETVSRLELHLFVVSIRVEDDDADPLLISLS